MSSTLLAMALALAVALPAMPTAAGPVTVSPTDPKWVVQDGEPLFLCGPGDPENFLHRGTLNADGTRNGDQDAIIQKLIGTGANCLWMTTIRSHGGDGGPTENPFQNNDPAQGIDPDVLDQWEGWVSALDAAGIISFFVFYDDGSRVWNTGSTVGAAEADYFQTLVNRFEAYDHIMWCVSEEYVEAYNSTRAAALADTIAAADDYDHPVSVHQHEGTQFHFPDHPSLDVFPMHCGYDNTPSSLHGKVLSAWDFADGRYAVVMAESINHYGSRSQARRLSWSAAMGGCPVMVHAMDVINTPVEALEDCGRLVDFFHSVPFATMEPRDELAEAETDYVFGDPAVGWIVYAAERTGTIGLEIPVGADGTFDFHWMDTETGATAQETSVSLAAGSHSWTPPSGLGADVVVFVELSTSTTAGAQLEADSWARVKGRYLIDRTD